MLQEAVSTDSVIHDMRNLLTVISLNCVLLDECGSTGAATLVREISQATEYLEALIEGLDSATTLSDHDEPASDVDQILRQVAGFARTMNPQVEFHVSKEPTGLRLRIEQRELLRCLLNLAVNAAEAATLNTPTPPVVEFSTSISTNRVAIRVVDTGGGFQQSTRKSFVPYVSDRPSNSIHRGLGLHVVKSIVESYGGEIRIARTVARTEISAEFPIALAVRGLASHPSRF